MYTDTIVKTKFSLKDNDDAIEAVWVGVKIVITAIFFMGLFFLFTL